MVLPVPRVAAHGLQQGIHQTGTFTGGQVRQFVLDSSQVEKRLTQGKCQRRANFENSKVAADHAAQRLRGLVIGGVSFVDHAFLPLDEAAQVTSLITSERKYLSIAKLHTRRDDNSDNTFQSICQPETEKNLTMHCQHFSHIVYPCNVRLAGCLRVYAPRSGHFRPDHV